MELTSISFQKYKAFPSSESIDIRPLTILIGRNSSGKSVIARLPLLLGRAFSAQAEAPIDLNFDDLDFGASFVDLIHDRSPHGAIELGATIEQGEGQTESLRARIQYFDEYKLHIVSHFRYEYSAEGSITLTWLGTDPLQEGETYRLEETGETCQVRFQGLFPCILNPVGPVSDTLKLFRQRLEEAQNRFAEATAQITYLGPFREVPRRIYPFPAGVPQRVGPGGMRAPEILADDAFRRKGVLRDAIGEWFRNHLGGWLLDVAMQGDTFALVLRDPNNPTLSINIVDVGTGIAQVLPIVVQRQFATLSKKPTDVEIVEQPELHLHPGVHGDLADLYIEAVNRSRVRFIIETHSENFLLRIRRRIAEGHLEPGKVMIYWVKDRTDAIPRIQPIHIDRSGDVDTWPTGVFSEDFQEVRAMRKAQQKIE